MSSIDYRRGTEDTEQSISKVTKFLVGILIVGIVLGLIFLLVQSTGENTEAKMNHHENLCAKHLLNADNCGGVK